MKTKTQKKWAAVAVIPLMILGLSLISWTGIPSIDSVRSADQHELREAQIEENPDKVPQFPGGEMNMYEYLTKSIVYPQKAQDEGLEGIVYIQFIVERSGTLSGFKLLRGVHETLDREAMRVLRGMPNWTPGEKDGKAVATRFTIPIKFMLKQ